jgi:hypothetical protein
MNMTTNIASKHGTQLRGLSRAARSSIGEGRFGRLFRWLPEAQFDEDLLFALARTMVQREFEGKKKGEALDLPITELEPEDENPTIPAGWTYFGQFLDHDITFDPIPIQMAHNDVDALHDFRTPKLDLDSVYGGGPELQPYLYEADGVHLLLGNPVGNASGVDAFDLPRNSARRPRALIGDKRNDENLIVNQLHCAFIRFHNAVVDRLTGTVAPDKLFDEAHRMVRWHYQWVVLREFLPLIVGEKMAADVRGDATGYPKLHIFKSKTSDAFMPVEFSVAAYRYGHSMIRPSYSLNTTVLGPTGAAQKFDRVPVFSADDVQTKPLANLNGFRPLPQFWGIDWSFYFEGLSKPKNGPSILTAKLKIPQPSYRIDTILVDPLAALPEFADKPAPMQMLAFRNLLRGSRMGLPSGQDVARLLGVKESKILSDAVLFENRGAPFKPGEDRAALLAHKSGTFKGRAPLWYYILKEAELTKRAGVKDPEGGGHHLGPVGGQIVAEVLTGLVWHDKTSYLRMAPGWQPSLGKGGEFGMADLLKIAGVAR